MTKPTILIIGAAGNNGMDCHAPANVMVDSPKLGQKAEWTRRLSKGLEKTIDNAINGIGAMPLMLIVSTVVVRKFAR